VGIDGINEDEKFVGACLSSRGPGWQKLLFGLNFSSSFPRMLKSCNIIFEIGNKLYTGIDI